MTQGQTRSGPRVGAAIATFNSRDELHQCLQSAVRQCDVVVVVDDGSTDGTAEMIASDFPAVHVVKGDGTLWWAGGTNAAVARCLQLGCDFVLLLNPDVSISPGCVTRLLARVSEQEIAAALVIRSGAHAEIAWGGTQWGRVARFVPIYCSRYIHKAGTPVACIGLEPYGTSEVHGRAVLVSRETFARLGMFDAKAFPHYGADCDFSLRARAAGIGMLVVPDARAFLDVAHSGMALPGQTSLGARVRSLWSYLTVRKHGEALRMWWRLLRRHVPWYAVVPSYVFTLTLNVARRIWARP